MSRLGIFVNRQTLSSSEQLTALVKCRDAGESMGHTVEFIFPVDIKKIPKLDALFIRANTDPMNTTYVAAKMAQMSPMTTYFSLVVLSMNSTASSSYDVV